jgi:hypothetical protein
MMTVPGLRTIPLDGMSKPNAESRPFRPADSRMPTNKPTTDANSPTSTDSASTDDVT